MPYIDTEVYYQRRRDQQNFALMLRNYYKGQPYDNREAETLGSEITARSLWTQFMQPDPSDEEPVYLENSIRNKIDDIVTDVFPIGTKVIYEGLEDDTLREAVLKKLLNFTDDYPSGEAGLREWISNVLSDIAQTGDGAAALEAEGLNGDALVRFKFFPSEAWDGEQTERHLPLFYRIEYIIKNEAGEDVVRRWDFYKDRIVEYAGKPDASMGDDGAPPPNPRPLNMGLMITAPVLFPGREDKVQSALMQQLDDWIIQPLRWQRMSAGDERGTSEILMNDLSTTDDINRLLRYWKDGAIDVGSPPLAAYDTEMPGEAGAENKELNKKALGPGAVLQLTSSDYDRQGKLTYPENAPSTFPHKDVLDRFRVAISGSSPLSNLDPQQISRFGELSGFSKNVLEKVHVERVGKIRDSVLQSRLAKLMETGIVMLALKGAVEGLTEAVARKVRVRFEFGGQVLSPDEQLKLVTMVAMVQKLGLPPNELVTLLPFDLLDRNDVISKMDEMQQQKQEMDEMLLAAKTAPPVAGAKKEGGNAPSKQPDKRGG